jgi:hypothetical protein
MSRAKIVTILYIVVFLLAMNMKLNYKKIIDDPVQVERLYVDGGSVLFNTSQYQSNTSLKVFTPVSEDTWENYFQNSPDQIRLAFTKRLQSSNAGMFSLLFQKKQDEIQLFSTTKLSLSQEQLQLLERIFSDTPNLEQHITDRNIKPMREILSIPASNFNLNQEVLESSGLNVWIHKVAEQISLDENKSYQLTYNPSVANRVEFTEIESSLPELKVEATSLLNNADLDKVLVEIWDESNSYNPQPLFTRSIEIAQTTDRFQLTSAALVGGDGLNDVAYEQFPIRSIVTGSDQLNLESIDIRTDDGNSVSENTLDVTPRSISQNVVEIEHTTLEAGEYTFTAIASNDVGETDSIQWSFSVRQIDNLRPKVIPIGNSSSERALFELHEQDQSLPVAYEGREVYALPINISNDNTAQTSYRIDYPNNTTQPLSSSGARLQLPNDITSFKIVSLEDGVQKYEYTYNVEPVEYDIRAFRNNAYEIAYSQDRSTVQIPFELRNMFENLSGELDTSKISVTATDVNRNASLDVFNIVRIENRYIVGIQAPRNIGQVSLYSLDIYYDNTLITEDLQFEIN